MAHYQRVFETIGYVSGAVCFVLMMGRLSWPPIRVLHRRLVIALIPAVVCAWTISLDKKRVYAQSEVQSGADPWRNKAEEKSSPSSDNVYVVQPGDNLWAIAERHFPENVHTQWKILIENNREHLRSGDTNLIFPGEEIIL